MTVSYNLSLQVDSIPTCRFIFIFYSWIIETVFHYVALDDLELRDLPAPPSVLGIKGCTIALDLILF